ncbi:MAG: flotillin domain-containing protein, partial [Pseudomonadota bacterium]
YRATTMAETAEAQSQAEERREFAAIKRDSEVRAKQIATDREIRELELQSELSVKSAHADTEIALAAKKAEEASAEAAASASIAEEVKGREMVTTAREAAMAERAKLLAVIKAQEEAAVDDTRTESQAGTVRMLAEAEAQATEAKARAARAELLAKAEGEAAVFAAENSQAGEIVRMKLDLAKIDALPEVVREMVKPAEKIDSIRINHVAGFGNGIGGANGSGGGGGSDGPMVNQVVDGILSMALQLPAVQKLGEEIGMNVAGGVHRLGGEATGEAKGGAGEPAPSPKAD